jgi:general stress protein 26
MNQKQKVLDFIKSQRLAVLTTINSSNKPESAAMGVGETDNLELIFGTYLSSRKYKNLQSNPNVSVVIGWDNNITVQYEGIATEIEGEEKEKLVTLYYTKHKNAQKYKDKPEERYFKVTPKWLRYSNLNSETWDIFEITF